MTKDDRAMKPQITVAKESRSRRRSFIPIALNLLALAVLFGCARDKDGPGINRPRGR